MTGPELRARVHERALETGEMPDKWAAMYELLANILNRIDELEARLDAHEQWASDAPFDEHAVDVSTCVHNVLMTDYCEQCAVDEDT